MPIEDCPGTCDDTWEQKPQHYMLCSLDQFNRRGGFLLAVSQFAASFFFSWASTITKRCCVYSQYCGNCLIFKLERQVANPVSINCLHPLFKGI
jgi:hypothetical protein